MRYLEEISMSSSRWNVSNYLGSHGSSSRSCSESEKRLSYTFEWDSNNTQIDDDTIEKDEMNAREEEEEIEIIMERCKFEISLQRTSLVERKILNKHNIKMI